jgi:hypothetical protein
MSGRILIHGEAWGESVFQINEINGASDQPTEVLNEVLWNVRGTIFFDVKFS